jgi:hypothetical protein
MNSFLLQLAMAALSQLGGGFGGPMQAPTLGPGLFPAPMPGPAPRRRPPPFRRPTGPTRAQGEQVATLAVATCQLRSGVVSRSQARRRLQGFGESRGWPPGWGQAIPLQRIDATIRGAGGCEALLSGLAEDSGRWPGRRGPGVGRAMPTLQSPSQAEGFGLAPYR